MIRLNLPSKEGSLTNQRAFFNLSQSIANHLFLNTKTSAVFGYYEGNHFMMFSTFEFEQVSGRSKITFCQLKKNQTTNQTYHQLPSMPKSLTRTNIAGLKETGYGRRKDVEGRKKKKGGGHLIKCEVWNST